MTLEEKATLVVGAGMKGATGNSTVIGLSHSLVPGATGTSVSIPRLGIPAMVFSDGPAGVRISPFREGIDETFYCTAFPIATALASTWNLELVENIGKAMGNEVLEYGIDIFLAPGMNIQRNPLCGRNFEYYSEDPLITGKMGAAVVKGVQSNGVGTSIKHFAANNQETNRMYTDSRLTQRALREIYLKGFEIAVKESTPWSVMSSYNHINGTYAPHSKELLTNILRDEWGFKGVVITDWFGGKSGTAMMEAGNDLIMPGLPKYKKEIIRAVENGTLKVEVLDNVVRRILTMIVDTPRFKAYKYTDKPNLKAHAELVRQSASEGMVLLENKNSLPFSKNVKNIAVYGVSSYDFLIGGTGSGDVNEAYSISLAGGLENAGYRLDINLKNQYEKHVLIENEKYKPDPNDNLASYLPRVRPYEILPERNQLDQQANTNDIALITIGRNSGEFQDRKIADDFELSVSERKLIDDICQSFHAKGKKVVVILNIGGVVETASWKVNPDAILLAWQCGQEAGNSITDVLSGKVNPSGKLTMTFPVKYMDVASSANFPTEYAPKNPVEMAMGRSHVKPEEILRNVDYTFYEEDIYVGYRFFDTFQKTVSYPFGYGLSYTKFAYGTPLVKENNGIYTVTIDVTNVGKTRGKEVVQLYVSAPSNPEYSKPQQELKGFAKTKELAPGKSEKIIITFKASDLASFDEKGSSWIADKGVYKIQVASSSRDIRCSTEFTLQESIIEKVNNVLQPIEPINILKVN